jgi:hypothetical protein
MPNLTTPLTPRRLAPRLAAARTQLRAHRQARASQRSLERELATYVSDSDLNDLSAILDRHSDADAEDIRQILAAQRTSLLLGGK